MSTHLPANIETLSPAEVFSDGKNIASILNEVTRIVDAHDPVIETEAGRKEIASLAYSVARSKTYLDDKGKELVSDWKQKAKAVDATRKLWRDSMDALKSKARAPLDEWEAKEDARKNGHAEAIDRIIEITNAAGTVEDLDVLDSFKVSIEDFTGRDFEEYAERAESLIPKAQAAIEDRITALEKLEADRAELERLRKEAAEREQKEREDALKKEAAEAERARAEQEKEAALEAERRKQELMEKEKQAAIEAQKQAEDRERQAKIEAEQKAAKAVEDERLRVEAERQREAAEAKVREENKKHKAAINNEALECLVQESGINQEDAKRVVEAIAKRLIKHVSISY